VALAPRPADDPVAVALADAIRAGHSDRLEQLLREHPDAPKVQIAEPGCDNTRSLLHVATDWPGHFPNVAATIAILVQAGADVNARGRGRITETPLHWAASGDDIEALDALLDAGADIEATGAVIANGTPLSDAVAFGQWNAARRLVERGATVPFPEAAALGLMELVVKGAETATEADLNGGLWYACHGGQRPAAEYLLERGADPAWIAPWDGLTPAAAARRSGAEELADWIGERR
jgi:hypothetical protein